jgi:Lon protease-like protein
VATLEIPLFPLQTVLFPGGQLPLVIFEERYKTMTRELLQSGGVFGVLLIKRGREVGGSAVPHTIGTTATIEDVEELEDGRFRIQARGQRRFRLVRSLPPRPYPYGEIEYIIDQVEEGDVQLARALETVRTVFPSYFRLAFSLTGQWALPPELPQAPHRLVDRIAPWLQVEESVKQRLLEIVPAAERVAYLAEVLDDLMTRTQAEVIDYRRRKFHGFGAQN